MASLRCALPLLSVSGLLSVTCYMGHAEGIVETAAVREFARGLGP
jgi:hypothetical protein